MARCCAAAGLALGVSQCLAAERSWSNTAGGVYSTTTNWVNNIPAGANDVANFRNSGITNATYTITFSANQQVQALRVNNDRVTFDLGGRSFTTTSLAGSQIGIHTTLPKTARLTIQNGTFTTAANSPFTLGAIAGGFGTLNVTTGATLTGSPRILVGGPSATGSFLVNGGGGAATALVNHLDLGSGSSSNGNAIITGPFSTLTTGNLNVGNLGNGTMLISLGAVYQNNGAATIGFEANTSGLVTVDGPTTRWNQTGPLLIGYGGAGSVNILNGARLTGSTAVLASAPNSTATVRLDGPSSGTQWTNPGTLTIASLAHATLTIAGGGVVNAGTTNIGVDTTAAGTVNISGAGSSATFARLRAGILGAATFNVTDGGALNAGTIATFGIGTGTTAMMNIIGPGSSVACGTLTLGENGRGTISISDGARLTSTGTAELGWGSDTGRFGQVNVSGPGSSWINSGTIDLDFQGRGKLRITNGGTVECNGTFVGGFAGLDVNGAGSHFLNTGTMQIIGSVSVNNGGVVDNTDSTATHLLFGDDLSIVSGAGSRWNNSGTLHADSSIQISSGGQVTAGNTIIERDARITASSNATLTTSRLDIGTTRGGGSLTVQFGGRVHSTSGEVVGNRSSTFTDVSTVKISNSGSTWQNDGSLIVGALGSATLLAQAKMDLSSGATVSNQDAFIAMSPTSIGTVTVGGSGTSWTSHGDVYVGGDMLSAGGTGVLDVSAGGRVTVTDRLTVWDTGVVDLKGGTLSAGGGGLTNSGSIQISSGSNEIFGVVSNSGQIVTANAQARFHNDIFNTSEFRVASGGTATLLGELGGAAPGIAMVETGGSLSAPRIRGQAVTVNGNVNIVPGGTDASTSRLSTLAILGSGRFDVADNDLIVTSTPAATIQSFISAARNGGAWDLPGLTSSAAAAHPQQATTLGLLGGAEYISVNSTTFDGFNVAPSDVLVKYTWYGDTDFNGSIDFDDYVRIDAGLNNGLSGWMNGDFDLNGSIDFDDYVLIDLGFNAQNGTLRRAQGFLDGTDHTLRGMNDDPALRMVVDHFDRLGAAYASHFLAAVPEPACLGVAMVLACARRRSRRRR